MGLISLLLWQSRAYSTTEPKLEQNWSVTKKQSVFPPCALLLLVRNCTRTHTRLLSGLFPF